ncbi:MAG TPA: SH3 domain-containing protein [Nitrospirales bacterium]|nr:SH3 domain-containing protein [Nitrospirales bacterium]
MKNWVAFLTIVLIWVFPAGGNAADPGIAVRSCQVMSEPFKDAQEVTSLKEGDTVEILKRKGGWLQVSQKGHTGWVRMLYIRRGASAENVSAATEASGLLGLATGRAGSGNVVAATGVRGLNEEELKEAKFNEHELQKLKTYRASKKQAQEFANQAGLTVQKVPFIQPTDGN